MLSSGVSATQFHLKTERSSCPRNFKKKADREQRLFACQGKKHWPPCSGTCLRCCRFQPFGHSPGFGWSPCPSVALSPLAGFAQRWPGDVSQQRSFTLGQWFHCLEGGRRWPSSSCCSSWGWGSLLSPSCSYVGH